MKKVKLKFFYELVKVLTALVLGTGGAIVALLGDVAIQNKTLLMFSLILLIAVLGLALVLVLLLVYNKIK